MTPAERKRRDAEKAKRDAVWRRREAEAKVPKIIKHRNHTHINSIPIGCKLP